MPVKSGSRAAYPTCTPPTSSSPTPGPSEAVRARDRASRIAAAANRADRAWTATPTGRRSGSAPCEFVNDADDRPHHPPSCCPASRPSPTASCRTASPARSPTALREQSGAARRSCRRAGLHQRRLHDRRHGADAHGRDLGSAADQCAGHPVAAHRRRDRAERDRIERRLPRRCRRTGADRPRSRRGWSCSTTTPRWTTTARRSKPLATGWPKRQPGGRRNAGRCARTREHPAAHAAVRFRDDTTRWHC